MKSEIDVKDRRMNRKMIRNGLVIILLVLPSFILPIMSSTNYITFDSVSAPLQYLPSAETPILNLSYTSRTLLTDTPVKSGGVIAGDHVKLKSVWSPPIINRSRLEINAHAIPTVISIEANQATLEIDTRALGNNASCTITATAWLDNGTAIVKEFTNVYIGNFFVPKVHVVNPNGEEDWTSPHNITWIASDVNVDDELLFDVYLSSDNGKSFEILTTSTSLTWFEFDFADVYRLDSYLIRVRVTDGIYYSSDTSDGTFTAGTIVTTTTTTPTTTPTTTTPVFEPRIVIFIAILLFSSGVMALVVYYAARKWI